MKKSSPVEQTLLFAGLLYSRTEYLLAAKERLGAAFGKILSESDEMPWDKSDCYKEEMGWPIKRRFLFFTDRIRPENLPEIKILTNEIEDQMSTNGKRNINIDPGYLTLSRVVLASTKNYSHRIYLGKGIYAEVTLVHCNGRFQPHIFTYPDFSSSQYIRIFEDARAFLK